MEELLHRLAPSLLQEREMEERLHRLALSLLQERKMEEWLHRLAPILLFKIVFIFQILAQCINRCLPNFISDFVFQRLTVEDIALFLLILYIIHNVLYLYLVNVFKILTHFQFGGEGD